MRQIAARRSFNHGSVSHSMKKMKELDLVEELTGGRKDQRWRLTDQGAEMQDKLRSVMR